MITEIELKAVVDDLAARRRQVESAGGRLVYAGRLHDHRYDTADRDLARRDHVLRVRIYGDEGAGRAELGFKGPTAYADGFKIREEIAASTGGPSELGAILKRLGYIVTRVIDRTIAQYELCGAVVRFEEYPRMDVLVEIEGQPAAIECAIEAIGLPRHEFTTDRLPDFVARFEAATGQRAALCDDELAGRRWYAVEDA
ncbi:MAG TPA: class IV adenylate cyclase [Gemmatimonadaceae bacterium]|nr:class IV adenylate cyclase [Gemmatimonadaceae bacterium]